MGRGRPERLPAPQLVEDFLQLVGPRDDDADADGVQVEEQPERGQVAVVERVFVVPLDLKANFTLETINLVSGRIPLLWACPGFVERSGLGIRVSGLTAFCPPL